MNLYINGSNRKKNSYSVLKELMSEEDVLVSLSDLQIQYCLGCCKCMKELPNYCVIKDDMKILYDNLLKAEKIIIMTPIYMNQITGILKNMIDRLNPLCCHELLKNKNKKVYLITVGQMEETENEEVAQDIQKYFEGISEFFYFEFHYLRNLSSGDLETVDSIEETYQEEYPQILKQLREKIEE